MNAVPLTTAAIVPTVMRCHRSASHPRVARSAIRNQTPAESALAIADMRFIRSAGVGAIGRSENVRPSMTNNGLPGGCGVPKVNAAAMYSPASQNATVGASVIAYSANMATVTIPAAR